MRLHCLDKPPRSYKKNILQHTLTYAIIPISDPHRASTQRSYPTPSPSRTPSNSNTLPTLSAVRSARGRRQRFKTPVIGLPPTTSISFLNWKNWPPVTSTG